MSELEGYIVESRKTYKIKHIQIDNFITNNLPNEIEVLKIRDCTILSFEGLENLPRLRRLSFHNVVFEVEDYTLLSRIKNLQSLAIKEVECSNDKIILSNLKGLYYLKIVTLNEEDEDSNHKIHITLENLPDLATLYMFDEPFFEMKGTFSEIINLSLYNVENIPFMPKLENLVLNFNSSEGDLLPYNLYKIAFRLDNNYSSRNVPFNNYKERIKLQKQDSPFKKVKLLNLWQLFLYEKRDNLGYNRFSYLCQ